MSATADRAPSSPPGHVLRVAGLSVDYATSRGPVHAVRDVSFSIRRGETFGVVGESGSGKSTVAFAVMGYLSANGLVTEGCIEYQGQDLLRMPRRQLDALRGARIAMVYQDPMSSLNPSITVGEQVMEALLAHERLSGEAARKRTLELFAAVNMPEPAAIFRRYPHQLSGGQQQRVLIAMALSCNPDLLIMDEPTTGLDVTTEAQILDLIASLKARFSSAILYISHNLGVIARVSDRLGVMYAGQMVEQGPVREVFSRQLHPYTAGLLECLPKLDFGRKSRSLTLIPGMIPDLARMPRGCSFEPRCRHAKPRCRDESPALVEVGAGHTSRCFFWQELEHERHTGIDATPAVTPTQTAAAATAAVPAPLLTVEDLARDYVDSNKLLGLFGTERVVHALDGVTLSLQPNETLAVVGESGCGKTTLARCVVGLVEPTRGRITFSGAALAGIAGDRDREVRRRLQMVFQNPDSTLNPRRTIGDALRRPLRMFRGLAGAAADKAAIELLNAVRLDERYLNRLPSQLSGGEKQRVGIARAFASRPEMVLCDEPVSALDVSVQAAVLNLLLEIQNQYNTTMVFIAHDLSVVRFFSDYVAVMYLGHVVEFGPAEAIYAPPYHPYTEALLSAVPIPDPGAEQKHIRLEGSVPSALNPPSGCPFHTRCPRRTMLADGGKICETEVPPWRYNTDEHRIFCHIPLEELRMVEPVVTIG